MLYKALLEVEVAVVAIAIAVARHCCPNDGVGMHPFDIFSIP